MPDNPTTANRFRKKPVVIEAMQFEGGLSSYNAIVRWSGRNDLSWDGLRDYMTIPTLEGLHRADVDDWIIRGVKGELYPCKPDIFEMTYEPAE